uniref:Squalene monooxygenase n=1 Tax=Palpitomonas bilix TaxID=652834 RepID=A0A7S3G9F9_9EUKA|mmetsp:Transcript_4125/g.8081  ORF Transcript_4125/g.8081 Transcript_4125/m.8081 type:complete len:473 (+) Transcript_4125:247-1665(+)
MEHHQVIIVGAGVAGTPLAYHLGRNGKEVLILERSLEEPDRIVGELLQPAGVDTLERLGLRHTLDDIDAQEVKGYVVALDDDSVHIPYPTDEKGNMVKGLSFHNGRFITKLRNSIKDIPNVELRQGTVTEIVRESNDEDARVIGVKYKNADGEMKMVTADLTVVCDGCFSSFRKEFRGDDSVEPKVYSNFVGVVIECDTALMPKEDHACVILSDPAPILLYQIGTNQIRCLVDFPPGPLPSVTSGDMKNFLLSKIYPRIPEPLKEHFEAAVEAGRIKSMRNQVMPASPTIHKGVCLLGDAFNMRHPLTGGGQTVVLSDVEIVKDLLNAIPDLRDQQKVTQSLKEFYVSRLPKSASINILATALYGVFTPGDNPTMREVRDACFDYFKAGGENVRGPISLLSGINTNSTVLVRHFFAVAAHATKRVLKPFPTPGKLFKAAACFLAATNLIKPLLVNEGFFQTLMPAMWSRKSS